MAASTFGAIAGESGSRLTLRILLGLAALAELVESASSVPALFMDHSQIPGPGLGGTVFLITIGLTPLLAFACIGGVLMNWPRVSVCGLAGVGICTWFNYLPSVVLHGLELPLNLAGVQMLANTELVLPIALIAIFLVLCTAWVNLAAALACLPTGIKALGLIVFAVAVSIHGF
jgi:hypothetical protein